MVDKTYYLSPSEYISRLKHYDVEVLGGRHHLVALSCMLMYMDIESAVNLGSDPYKYDIWFDNISKAST